MNDKPYIEIDYDGKKIVGHIEEVEDDCIHIVTIRGEKICIGV